MLMLSAFRGWLNRDEGQALVEYALILALVSVVAIGILTTLGVNIVTILTSVANAL
jgi:pilus assembly protein Flp/PilA